MQQLKLTSKFLCSFLSCHVATYSKLKKILTTYKFPYGNINWKMNLFTQLCNATWQLKHKRPNLGCLRNGVYIKQNSLQAYLSPFKF